MGHNNGNPISVELFVFRSSFVKMINKIMRALEVASYAIIADCF